MLKFIDEDFLLKNETAKILYDNYASKLPIIDYHCHISPKDIAEIKSYRNIAELWLGGDHYKWRAMRSCGISEELITGNASDYEKFRAYAGCMPKLIGNPLYHWSHLELIRYFGYTGVLNADTCDKVWNLCNEKLTLPEMSAKNIVKNSGVEILCTTDDPIDDLRYHSEIANDKNFGVKVLPAFRPDKGLKIYLDGYRKYIDQLSEASGVEIKDFATLKQAYINRLDFFEKAGCKTADHGLDYVPCLLPKNEKELDVIFRTAYENDGNASKEDADKFITAMLIFFAKEYTKRHFVMQIHYGVLRNPNSVWYKKLGADTGFDMIGNSRNSVSALASLFDRMTMNDGLPRCVIYPIDPNENAAVATLLGSYQCDSEGGMPRLMQGSAWWFNDNLTGMRAQMITLANLSSFGNFLGMLTDSRSFISYPRHEYFRRILCNLVGEWVENGEFPYDIEAIANIVIDICYNNTKNYFGF